MSWQEEIIEFCRNFSVPIEYLAPTLSDPKVVPMIRGKAFEFSATAALEKILPKDEWLVEKLSINAQSEIKDIDVKVTHLVTNKIIRVECKLAGNKGFRAATPRKPYSTIKVKCMRSRTLGTAKVESQAPKMGVSKQALSAHADSYRVADFDVVLTSIGNTFYRTNDLGEYEWCPTKAETEFLELLNPNHPDHKISAFAQMYLIKSINLSVGNTEHLLTCTKKNCANKTNCGFIPNYPLIQFPQGSTKPNNGWVSIAESADLFNEIISQPKPLEAEKVQAEQLQEQIDS